MSMTWDEASQAILRGKRCPLCSVESVVVDYGVNKDIQDPWFRYEWRCENVSIGYFSQHLADDLRRARDQQPAPIIKPKYPHSCFKCGSPAQHMFNLTDCSNKECR